MPSSVSPVTPRLSPQVHSQFMHGEPHVLLRMAMVNLD